MVVCLDQVTRILAVALLQSLILRYSSPTVAACDGHDNAHSHREQAAGPSHVRTTGRQLQDYEDNGDDVIEECGFRHPPSEQLAEDEMRMKVWSRGHATFERVDGIVELHIIPVHVHILQPNIFTAMVPDVRVTQYMEYLNDAFSASGAPFVFDHVNTTRTFDVRWSEGCGDGNIEAEFKAHLKVGGAETLNIYMCPSIPNSQGVNGIAGYAYLPHAGSHTWVKDGIVLARSNNDRRLNTLVHETGHFMGLYHTFGSQTCDPSSTGDSVGDTAQHISKAQSVNCHTDPSSWDTCPDLAGTDPVDNYMTYSSDNFCRTKFTPGQIYRMLGQFELYRQKKRATEPPMTSAPSTAPTTAPSIVPTAVPSIVPTETVTFAPTLDLSNDHPAPVAPLCANMFASCTTNDDCCSGICYSLLARFSSKCWF